MYVAPVTDARNGAKYLAKYFTKGFGDRGELERRGFVRRWSASRDWPRVSTSLNGDTYGSYVGWEVGVEETLSAREAWENGRLVLDQPYRAAAVRERRMNVALDGAERLARFVDRT